MLSLRDIIYLFSGNLLLTCMCYDISSLATNTGVRLGIRSYPPDFNIGNSLNVIYSLLGGQRLIDEENSYEEEEENEFTWDLVDKRDENEEFSPQKSEEDKISHVDYDSEEDYSVYSCLPDKAVNKYSSLSDSGKDDMINCLIQKYTTASEGREMKLPTYASSNMKKNRNFKLKRSFPQITKKNKWIKNKHGKVPYILRIMFNSKNVWKMTKLYWASLFDVYYLEHNSPYNKSYNSYVPSTSFPPIRKNKTRQRRGQTRKLSDLPPVT